VTREEAQLEAGRLLCPWAEAIVMNGECIVRIPDCGGYRTVAFGKDWETVMVKVREKAAKEG